jgi:hypothetical protein
VFTTSPENVHEAFPAEMESPTFDMVGVVRGWL